MSSEIVVVKKGRMSGLLRPDCVTKESMCRQRKDPLVVLRGRQKGQRTVAQAEGIIPE